MLTDCFYEHVMATRREIPPTTPLLITEYSVMVGEGMALAGSEASGLTAARPGEPPFQHEDPGAAAFIFRVVPQLSPHLEALSYWTFSDSKPQYLSLMSSNPARLPGFSCLTV